MNLQHRILHIAFASLIIIYIFNLLALSHAKFYTTINRVTYPLIFEHIISEQYDPILVIIPALVTSIMVNRRFGIIYSILSSLIIIMIMQRLVDTLLISIIVSVATLPLLSVLMILHYRTIVTRQLLTSMLLLLIVFESIVLITWISYAITGGNVYDGSRWIFARVETAVFYITGSLSPLLAILIFFAYLYKPSLPSLVRIYDHVRSMMKVVRDVIDNAYHHSNSSTNANINTNNTNNYYNGDNGSTGDNNISNNSIDKSPSLPTTNKYHPSFSSTSPSLPSHLYWFIRYLQPSNARYILVASLALSAILSLYPYLPTINPNMANISVDVVYYTQWLNDMMGSGNEVGGNTGDGKSMYTSIIGKAFILNDGDRPLSLLLMFTIYKIVNIFTSVEVSMVIRFMPLFLAPILTYIVYRFALILYNDRMIASIVALFTPFSYHFVVGIYAGFFANWLALIAMYATLICLLLYIKGERTLHLLSIFLCLVLVMLLHVYTWVYLIAGLILFTIISIILKLTSRDDVVNREININTRKVIIIRKELLLMLIIVASIVTDVVRAEALQISNGIERDIRIAEQGVGYEQFLARWGNLKYTFTTYVGGYFTNLPLLLLVLIWISRASIRNDRERILLSLIYVGSLAIIFGDSVVQTRIFYNLPLHVAGIGGVMSMFLGSDKSLGKAGRERTSIIIIIILLLSILILLIMANYTLRALSNLVLRF